MAVADKVKSIIVEQLGVDEEEVTPDASFVDDLGADSLDTVELVMAFEEEFGIEIPDEDAEKITRVKEAVEYIESHGKQEVGRPRQGRAPGAAYWRRFEQASRRHGRRPGVVARHRHRGELGGALRGQERHRADHAVRRRAVRDAHRGRGQGLRSAPVHREERRQEDGRLHPVRDRGVAVRDGRCAADGHAGDRAARRRVHRVGHRRVHARSSASTRRCSRAARARSRRSSSRRPSSTWRPARCRSASAPRGRTRRPARPAPRRRTRSATRSRSSGAATPT